MIGFTLETTSFGERINLKSSANKIVHTFSKVLITNKVILDLNHKCGNNYQFAISIRRPLDNGSSYSTIKPIIFDNVGKFDATAYFDVDCPKGTWQLQIFLKNKITNLTEHFIYVDLVFSNYLEIKNDSQQCNELKFLNDNQLNINKEKINILSRNENLRYHIEIYRKTPYVNEKNETEYLYTLYYASKTYKTLCDLEIDWSSVEGEKTLEKHILSGLNGESHIYVRIETVNYENINLPEFTYVKYKVVRDKNVSLEYLGSTASSVTLMDSSKKPKLPLTIITKYDDSIIQEYDIKCEWLLFGEVNSGKKDSNDNLITTESLVRILHQNTYSIKNTKFSNGQNFNRIDLDNILAEDEITKVNYWNDKILPEKYYINKNNYIGNKSKKIHVKVTVTGRGKNPSAEIDEQTFNYIFNRFSKLPEIRDLDGVHLGDIKPSDFNNAEKIEKGQTQALDRLILKTYTVYDNDSSHLAVTEKLNVNKPSSTNKDNSKNENESDIEKLLTINEFNSRLNFNTELINNTAERTLKISRKQFDNLSDGLHTITVYASDGCGTLNGVDAYIKRSVTFNKVPNSEPIITTDNNLNLGKIAYAPKIVYHVTDVEKNDLKITELLDNDVINEPKWWSFDGKEKLTFEIDSKKPKYVEYFNKINDEKTHSITIRVDDNYNMVELKFMFVKTINSPPTIDSSINTNLGNLIKPIDITYNVTDTNNDIVVVTEYFDDENEESIIERNEYIGGIESKSINYASKFGEANEGSHRIIVTALEKGNESSKPVKKIYNFNKILNPIMISNHYPVDTNLGQTYEGFEVSLTVYNLLDNVNINNDMTYSVYIDRMKVISNEKLIYKSYVTNGVPYYEISYKLSEDSPIFNGLELGAHQLNIVIEDIGSTKIRYLTYNFEKIQKNPKLTLPEKQFFTYMYDMNNKTIEYYSTNKCLFEATVTNDYGDAIFPNPIINKLYPANSNGKINFTFDEDLWNSLNSDEIRIYVIHFKLTCLDDSDMKTKDSDTVSHRFIKSNKEDINQNVFTWRPDVDDDGDLNWTMDQSQSPVQTKNIKGPIGETGPIGITPKIDIGKVKNVDSGKQPKITINYPVDEDGNENREYPVLDFELPKGAGAGMYTSQEEVPVGIGGIPAGYKPPAEGIAIDDLFYMLLHPYTKPTISLLTNPSGGVFEIGNTINVKDISIKVGKKSKDIQSVELYNGNTLLQSFNDVANGGTFSYTNNISINSTVTIKAYANDGESTSSDSKTFTFVSPMYYGVSVKVPNGIEGLNKDISVRNNKSYSFTSDTLCYQVFSYPASYGNLSSITDKTGFECITGFTKIQFMLGSVNYNLYYTTKPSIVSNMTYNFKF